MHIRQHIRDWLVTVVSGAVGLSDGTVTNRAYGPFELEDLPVCAIVPLKETVEYQSLGSVSTQMRTHKVAVNLMFVQQDSESVWDTMDDVGLAVEVLIANAVPSNPVVESVELEECVHDVVADGSKPAGRLQMIYQVVYLCDENNPTTGG